jgi:hypothetical protein
LSGGWVPKKTVGLENTKRGRQHFHRRWPKHVAAMGALVGISQKDDMGIPAITGIPFVFDGVPSRI